MFSSGNRMRFALRLRAERASLSVMREALIAWLAQHGWPAHERDRLVTAVNEACTNAVVHAYSKEGDGSVEVSGRVHRIGTRRYIRLRVRDWGRWRPPTDDGERHMGLALIRDFVDRLEVRTLATGTELSITSGHVRHPVRRH
jgi:anti-sigma regulatory factor (Ser/Thr protein kinase)